MVVDNDTPPYAKYACFTVNRIKRRDDLKIRGNYYVSEPTLM